MGKHILLVDNYFDEIESLRDEFMKNDFEVTYVDNPYDALSVMKDEIIDVIVTDNDMNYILNDGEFTGIYLLQMLNGYDANSVINQSIEDNFDSNEEYLNFIINDVPEVRVMYSSSIDRKRAKTPGIGDVYFAKKNFDTIDDIIEYVQDSLGN